METQVAQAIAVVGSVGLAFPALALAVIGYAALTGLSRNPEAQRPIFINMILIAGLAEAVAVYALIIVIILSLVV